MRNADLYMSSGACFYVWPSLERKQKWSFAAGIARQRFVDCDCHQIHTCPPGPPPTPDWAEFIEPLLAVEVNFTDFEPPPPASVPDPSKANVWDPRPVDFSGWKPSKDMSVDEKKLQYEIGTGLYHESNNEDEWSGWPKKTKKKGKQSNPMREGT
jgi:hypothetical protein